MSYHSYLRYTDIAGARGVFDCRRVPAPIMEALI